MKRLLQSVNHPTAWLGRGKKMSIKYALPVLIAFSSVSPLYAQDLDFFDEVNNCFRRNSFLFKNEPSDDFDINLVTNDINLIQGGISTLPQPSHINSIGYNTNDNFVYGNLNGVTNTIVRYRSDGTAVLIPVTPPAGITLPDSLHVGDIISTEGANGTLYLTSRDHRVYWKVDLSTFAVTRLPINAASGNQLSNPLRTTDWAYYPQTGKFYFIRSTNGDLFEFDPNTSIITRIADLTGYQTNDPVGPNSTRFGAVFVASDGFFYISSNFSGNLYRIDLNNLTALPGTTPVQFIGVGPASIDNDGARSPLTFLQTDFGDAPESYGTLIADNGPRHNLREVCDDTTLQLGNTTTTHETDGQPGANADLDGAEDGISSFPLLSDPNGTSYSFDVTVNYPSGDPAVLACWVDFDFDGVFDNPSERSDAALSNLSGSCNDPIATDGTYTTGNIPSGCVGTVTVDFTNISLDIPDDTTPSYARCRITTDSSFVNSSPSPLGPAKDGEVEDYLVPAGTLIPPWDFGDAPNTFSTLSAANGPYHVITSGLHIGNTIDAEADGQPNATATGDGADEDGVNPTSLTILRVSSGTYAATLDISNVTNNLGTDAQLACWVNFDGNNNFSKTAERSDPGFLSHGLAGSGGADYFADAYHDPGAPGNPVGTPGNALGDPTVGDSVANIRNGEVLVLRIDTVTIQDGDSFDVHLRGNNSGAGTGTIQICTGSTGTGCGATIPITEAQTTTSVVAQTYTANATGQYLRIVRNSGNIRVDGVVYTAAAQCNKSTITDNTWENSGNVPAGCSGPVTVMWTGLTTVPAANTQVMSRCRITTEDGSTAGAENWFSNTSPTPVGPARDGEVEDHLVSVPPTAVTIGEVDLEPESVDAFLAELGVADQDSDALLSLLAGWSSEAAAELAGADRATILAALTDHLDPDGDGQVAVLRWDTLEERGTIGFYVERRVSGDTEWRVVNDDLLPGLVTAPLGGVYMLADPEAESGVTYEYQLIEQEAAGSTRYYGPFTVEMQ